MKKSCPSFESPFLPKRQKQFILYKFQLNKCSMCVDQSLCKYKSKWNLFIMSLRKRFLWITCTISTFGSLNVWLCELSSEGQKSVFSKNFSIFVSTMNKVLWDYGWLNDFRWTNPIIYISSIKLNWCMVTDVCLLTALHMVRSVKQKVNMYIF